MIFFLMHKSPRWGTKSTCTLLTLGIPGGAVTALILGAFMVHGLNPGPLLMAESRDLVYTIVVGMGLAQVFMLVFGLLLARVFSRVARVPKSLLTPIILFLCASGSFALRNSFFDVFVMISAGLLGYIMIKNDIPRAPLVIGMILSNMIESNLSRTVQLIKGDYLQLLTPISTCIYILILVPFLLTFYKRFKKKTLSNLPEQGDMGP
jgi:putative tricarboxylic transport membrane protein